MQYKIPFEFIQEKTCLSWSDIQYGLDHLTISPKIAIQLAQYNCQGSPNPESEEVELAELSDTDSVIGLVSALASREKRQSENTSRDKWVFVALSWLYENKESFSDPLAVVEDVYADSGYPRNIASFVRSMPMQGPDLGSSEKNIARLYSYWKDYLAVAGKRFAPLKRSASSKEPSAPSGPPDLSRPNSHRSRPA